MCLYHTINNFNTVCGILHFISLKNKMLWFSLSKI